MGHLINPISNRLSVNIFWNSNWALTNNFNYVNVFKRDYILFQFLNWFIRKAKFGKFNIIISHYKVFRIYQNIFVNFYFYNAGLEEKKYRFQVFFLLNLLRRRKSFLLKKNDLFKSTKRFRRLLDKKNVLKKKSFSLSKSKNKILKSKILSFKIKSLYVYIIKTLISNLYWRIMNNSLAFFLRKLTLKAENFHFNIFSLDFLNVSTDVISTYISLKLQQRYSLNWVLRPILKDLTLKIKKKIFLGYKIVCSGRFTRKQIATYMWSKQGSIRLNNFTNLVKYSESTVRLKYGLCGVKVWLNYGTNDTTLFSRNLMLIYPRYTPFKYLIDFKLKNIILYLNYWFYIYIRIAFFKSKLYNFYKLFVNIKTKIIMKYLLKKLFKRIYYKKFDVIYLEDNKVCIQLANEEKSSMLLRRLPRELVLNSN